MQNKNLQAVLKKDLNPNSMQTNPKKCQKYYANLSVCAVFVSRFSDEILIAIFLFDFMDESMFVIWLNCTEFMDRTTNPLLLVLVLVLC